MFTSRILDISEINHSRRTASYEESVVTYLSDIGSTTDLNNNTPFYINAYCYLLIIGGEANLYVNETCYRLKAGCLIMQTPLHNTIIQDYSYNFQFSVVVISRMFLNNLYIAKSNQMTTGSLYTYSNPVIELLPDDCEIINNCIIDITNQIKRCNHSFQKELIQNSIIRFYLELHNAYNKISITDIKQPRHYTILRNFINLLITHFKEQHNVWFYAQELNITPHYLTKIVKEHTNMTPAKIIDELLYNEARYLLLHSTLSIQEIASKLNFDDQSSFGKFFKRIEHLSPLSFRKNNI